MERTLVISLEGFCSTIELHPRATRGMITATPIGVARFVRLDNLNRSAPPLNSGPKIIDLPRAVISGQRHLDAASMLPLRTIGSPASLVSMPLFEADDHKVANSVVSRSWN